MSKLKATCLAGLVTLSLLPALAFSQISVDVSVSVPPPELPVYDQPPIPGDGYIWTPGYWAWDQDDQDYYWVPGTWVPAPEPDYLWTPGYWAAAGALFLWHAGYWGPHVGFYGGVNYGYGYGGNGYEGGYWRDGHVFYNRSVNNIGNVHITNVYNKTVINNVTVNRVSYNGGNGGVRAQATQAQLAAQQERHIEATPAQSQHAQAAMRTPALRVHENQGHPPIGATARPGALSGAGVMPARGGGTMSVVHPQGQGEHPQAQGEHRVQPSGQPHPRPPAPQSYQAAPRAEPRDVEGAESRREPEQQQSHASPPPRPSTPPPRNAEPREPERAPPHESHEPH